MYRFKDIQCHLIHWWDGPFSPFTFCHFLLQLNRCGNSLNNPSTKGKDSLQELSLLFFASVQNLDLELMLGKQVSKHDKFDHSLLNKENHVQL